MTRQTHKSTAGRRKSGCQVLVWALGFTFLLCTPAEPTAGDERNAPDVRGFVPRAEEPLTAYRGLRRMHVTSDRFNQEGWLDAWTELDAQGFRYQIVSERGSGHVRNKVLKALLKREQDLIAEGRSEGAALTEENYVFTEASGPPDGLRYVLMKPKRKDVMLVDGRMVLTPDGSDVLRIEGRLAKSPSFWTSLVNVVRHFAKVDGVRVPVTTESIARVKFAGESRLDIVYEYESINGRPVTQAARRILASAAPR